VTEQANNWGRWGTEDERGAANFISAEALRKAVGLVRRGVTYSLSLPIQQVGTPIGASRARPVHVMTQDASAYRNESDNDEFCDADDSIALSVHTGTHIDALSHVWYGGRLYNDFPAAGVSSTGAERLGIERLRSLVGRGVLLDLCSYRGVAHLPGGDAIKPEELEGCANRQGVQFDEGDVLLVRTGWLTTYDDTKPDEFFKTNPGLGVAAAEWVGARRFAAVGADNFALEVHPSETGNFGPVHKRLIRDFGCYLIELLNLEELARDKVYEFLFVAAPLMIKGGVGSPINPLAIA
jgi:kynurenine formamidase